MCASIAIPEPTSIDPVFNQQSLPACLSALHAAGAKPVILPLHERPDRLARLISATQGILLPGSEFDIDPQKYGEKPIPECGKSDPARAAVDELLLQDAFSLHKPILAICGGMQELNVWLNGALTQDLKTTVNHQAGADVVEAHPVRIEPGSRLAELLPIGISFEPQVNSTHHQAVRVTGDGLVVSAISPADGVIEAVEFSLREHFVLGVQWHPERSYAESAFSRAIFAVFVQAAGKWKPGRTEERVATV